MKFSMSSIKPINNHQRISHVDKGKDRIKPGKKIAQVKSLAEIMHGINHELNSVTHAKNITKIVESHKTSQNITLFAMGGWKQ